MLLDKINYTVERLDGDYAYLKKDADASGPWVFCSQF